MECLTSWDETKKYYVTDCKSQPSKLSTMITVLLWVMVLLVVVVFILIAVGKCQKKEDEKRLHGEERAPTSTLASDFEDAADEHDARVRHLTSDAQYLEIQSDAQSKGIPLIIMAGASWCGFCRVMTPAFLQACGQMPQGFALYCIVDERTPKVTQDFGLEAYPAVVGFSKTGKKIEDRLEARDVNSLKVLMVEYAKEK